MAAAQQGQDRILTTDLTESLNILSVDTEEKTGGAEILDEQTLAAKDDRIVSPSVSHEPKTVGPSMDMPGQPGTTDASRDWKAVYPPNVYAPQAHTVYYGYDNASTEWEEYPQYVNSEGMELGSPSLYNENPSLVFHTGYGYNPQMPYGPYSPVTTPMPSVGGDGQMYSPQQFPFTGPYYQQPVAPNMPYINSQAPVSQPELSIPAGVDPQGFDLFGSGPWMDWSKSPDGHRSLGSLPSPAVSPQPLTIMGSFAHNVSPLAARMGSQQQRPPYGYGSRTNSYGQSYLHGSMYQGNDFGGSNSGLAMNGRSWIAADTGRRRGRGSGSLCSCNGPLDVLNEQNRGPRASRTKTPTLDRNLSTNGRNNESTPSEPSQLYNRPDFAIDYEDAKFFIIKSYSEDNVHKSIKYGVWASTANGNRRLDAAYREAKEKDCPCPVFLLFSVNASAHFCGVAEMMGLVDFDKSVDYWQQDKWSGQFPVKWHIIKDVPNSQFRHIILENNDNKPVTNSRDTQEVKLDQGLEILKILKNYESEQSILQDFEYYEDRQKIMQERKARQQANASPGAAMASIDHRGGVTGDLIKKMSRSLSQAVTLEDDRLQEKRSPPTAAVKQPEDIATGTSLQSN
ncbi:YTH domain-containing protein ECT1 [Aristolochia californica]|uniref:YTH domain-containing protein ECT1 n=1 Tax=Aristolochia californica TaxID=171875 RepID=UPI0035D89169